MSRIERAGEQARERQVVQLPRLAQNEVEDEEFDEVRASRRRYVSDCLSNVRTARCFFCGVRCVQALIRIRRLEVLDSV